MPYIKHEDREKYDKALELLPRIENKGDLEYCIYRLMKWYMHDRQFRYAELHDTVYAGIHSSHEFERRFLDNREDRAIKENGDILEY